MISLYHKKVSVILALIGAYHHDIILFLLKFKQRPRPHGCQSKLLASWPRLFRLALVAPFRPPPWKPGRKTNCFGRLPYLTIKIKFRLSHNTWESKHIKYILGAVYINLKYNFIFFTPSCSYSQGCQCWQSKISKCQAGNDPQPFHFQHSNIFIDFMAIILHFHHCCYLKDHIQYVDEDQN